MKEIVNRLQERRNIERAKSILESAGYKVSKKITESNWSEWYDNEHGEQYRHRDRTHLPSDLVASVYDVTEDGEGYVVEFWDNSIGDLVNVPGLFGKSFDTAEEAMEAVDEYFRSIKNKKPKLRPIDDSTVVEAISVDISDWSNSSGKKTPSGSGSWMFRIGKEEKSYHGKYADAKKQAQEYAKSQGVSTIELLG